MKRYSATWWLAILPSTMVVGIPAFLLLGYQTDWGVIERIAAALVCALVIDVAVANWMEGLAPTRVSIGPGEKGTHEEIVAEKAIVISGFKSSPEGQVSVRGETWNATRRPDDTEVLDAGMAVNVVDRIGLNLVVSLRSR